MNRSYETKGISLALRLVVWFVVVALLPLTLFGFMSLQQNEAALRSEMLSRMSRLADKKTLQIKTYLAERSQDVQILARGRLVEEAMPELSRIYTRYGADSAEYRRATKPFVKNFAGYIGEGDGTQFYDVFLITPQGEIIFTHRHDPDFATNLINGPYRDSQLAQAFLESRMTLENSISDFEFYLPSNAPAAFVSAPIIRDGVLLGVVAFQLDTQRIYEVAMDNTGLGVTGETPLAKLTGDGSAVFVAPLRHDPQAAMQRKIDLKTGAVPIRKSLTGERGSGVEIDYAGKQVVAAWRYLPELRWGVVVKMDADEALAPIHQQRKNLLQALLVLAVLGGFVAFYLGRRLVVPLKSFALTAGEIANGDLSKRVDDIRADEIGELGRAFNRMAENLQALYRTLEDRIGERTRELTVSYEQLQEEIIERKKIEKSLRESRQLLNSIVEHIPVMIFVKRASDLRFELFNRAGEKLLGYSRSDLLGKGDYDFWPKEQGDWFTAADRKALASQEVTEIPEEPIKTANGETRYLRTWKVALRDESGESAHLLGISIDITERKKAEADMLAARNQLEATIDAIPDLLFEVGLDGTYYDVHAQRRDLLAAPAEDLFGKKVIDVLPAKAAEVVMSALREAHELGHSHGRQFELLLLQGNMWFELSVSRKPTPLEQQSRFIVLSRDITERKQAEEVLKRHKQVLDATSDGFWMVDAMGNLLETNQAYADISGYSVEELLNMHISQLEAKEKSVEEVKAHIEKIVAQGADQFETRHRHKNGHEIDIEVNTVFMRETQQFAAFLRDITDRKLVEEELKQTKARYDYATAIGRVGTWDWHLGTGVLLWSDETFRLLGLVPGAVTPSFELFVEVVHPDDRAFLDASVQAALHENKPYALDCRLVTGADGISFCHIEGKAEFDAAGNPVRMVGTIQDITERKLTQLDLQRNQDLLNEAQRLGQLGSWELDLVSGELRWSDEIYRIFELDPAQFTPSYENFLNVIHPDDRDKVNAAYTGSLSNRQPYDVEHRLRMADGRIKWVREHCNSDFDAAGKPLRSVGAVQDITAQKLTEDSLRISAVTFETHEGIVITDAQATIMRVNRAFQQITGYGADEVVGKNPSILSSGRQSKEFYSGMWRQLLENGTWSGEIWDRRKNGEVYPKWLTITAVKDVEGRITEYVGIFSDITARKRAEEEIRNLAFYDALTGLPNRRLLLDRFHLAMSLSARSHHCGALMFLDMDKFKTLNDTMGHDYGDLMLIEVGRRIQACVREVDTVARLGGDEFVALIEEVSTNMQDALQKIALIAEKIRAVLAQPYMLKGYEYHSSPSIGVSMYRGSAEPVDVLMKHADMAMYQAKDAGRNTVRFFDPLMQQAVEAHAELEADLRGALPNRQLHLHYQIQVDGDHRPIGAEALIRWMHPRRGMVPPAQFIPIAEESTLILDIGNWVIEIACRQLAEWAQDERMRHLVLAVNVSAQQFKLRNFVEQLKEMIARHDIAPERLKLELTESVVLEDVADVVAKMHALKALGVRLSLDDFGTGYSSLTYLKQLPLHQIKIDQSFVRGITTDPSDAVMVKTIIDMAQNFRLNVIAEGVETEAQLVFLKQNECMAYQGYLFGRPVPVAEFEALVRHLTGRG